MITNIVDRRTNHYKWEQITAIVEPTCHDNNCHESDQATQEDLWFGYDENKCCSLAVAIEWASSKPGNNTLFLYDLGDGISGPNFHWKETV